MITKDEIEEAAKANTYDTMPKSCLKEPLRMG